MKILQICFRVPYPPTDGGAIAMFGITRNLTAQGHEVTVLAVNTPKHFQKDDVLNGFASKLITIFIDTTISPVKAFLNLFSPYPYIVSRFISREFEKTLKALVLSEKFDVVHFEGTFVAYYGKQVKALTSTPIFLRSHNLEYLIWDRLSKNQTNPFKALYLKNMSKSLKRFEKKTYKRFDLIAAITKEDAQRIRKLGVKTRVEVLPAGIDQEKFIPEPPPGKPNTCFIFSALDWLPNQEAVKWFVTEVWPNVVKEIPDAKLHIAGKSTPEDIFSLQNNNIKVHGFVKNAEDFILQYDLMLVPLLSGGGMRLKILEGMAAGKVIISTSVGAEGIDCRDQKNILICEKADEWAKSIIDYFKNRDIFQHIGKNGYELACDKYSNNIIIKSLIHYYEEIIKCR